MPEIVTFGCRLNLAESEAMRRHAEAAGLHDAIIINTCAVTAEAERQARQTIRRLKREQPQARIIVTGCAAEIAPETFSGMREVDHIIANPRKTEAAAFEEIGGFYQAVPAAPPPRQEGDLQRAFVEVQNGCDHRCTFCIIPYGRGASRSKPMGAVAEEVRQRLAEGYREVVFTGVDITSYGKDLPGRPSFGQMARRVLAAVPGLPRLRFSSLDPAAFDDDMWRLIGEEPRLMPHLHLSLQAGDDMILKRMKRRHSRADVIGLCDKARRLRPGIVFGADIIAGFPTETEAMFANTLDLVETCGLTWLHVFSYSARQGTPAAKMPQLHGSVRKQRADRLRQAGAEAAARHCDSLIGQTVEVLVERQGIGCTPHFAKVKLANDAETGTLARARIIGREGERALGVVEI